MQASHPNISCFVPSFGMALAPVFGTTHVPAHVAPVSVQSFVPSLGTGFVPAFMPAVVPSLGSPDNVVAA